MFSWRLSERIIVCSVSKKTSAAPNVRHLAHFRIPALTQEGMARVLCTIIRQNKNRDWKSGDGTMPENIIQIDQNLPGTRLDRLITEKMTQILNAMLDAATVASVRLRQRRSVSGAPPDPWRPVRSPWSPTNTSRATRSTA